MKPSLQNIIDELIDENDLPIDIDTKSDVQRDEELKNLVYEWIANHSEEMSDIAAEVDELSTYHDSFFKYFESDSAMKVLIGMYKTDPDRFFDNIKCYELFMNACAEAAGYNVRFHLNISNLLRLK